MAPVWEANNVWLVLAIVVCWTGFPLLFQSVFASLYPLFAVALVALILRGSFFAFRHVWTGPRGRRRTGRVFGISSIPAPFFFAAALGSVASGRVTVGGPSIPVWQACFNPTSISFGLVSLAATSFIGASFLVGDARRFGMPDMTAYFRRRAMMATVVLIIIGTMALAVIGLESPHFTHRHVGRTRNAVRTGDRGLHSSRRIPTLAPELALVSRSERPGRGLPCLCLGFWESPDLLPGQLTIAQAAAPRGTEVLLSIVTFLVVVLVLPSLALLVYLDQRGALESQEG